jgi:endonuclease III
MIKKAAFTLREAIKVLRRYYGAPEPLPTANPFELILLENVAYLSSPARRGEAFELLKRTVGTDPIAILSTETQTLEDVTAHGILKSTFAAKLRQCAIIAVDEFGGDLEPVVREPIESAKRKLQSFPGIGEPGAEKILLFTGQQALLAPDSNGLRVLVRLGLIREEKSYVRTYAGSRWVEKDLPADPGAMQEAHLLLQKHGQTLCKRNLPHCEVCPLASACAYASQLG